MPTIQFDSIGLVPEGLRAYAKVAGDYEGEAVSVDVVPAVRIDEFREANIRLGKERDELAERLVQADRHAQALAQELVEADERIQVLTDDLAASTRQTTVLAEYIDANIDLEAVRSHVNEVIMIVDTCVEA
ncbi:hypothetical protein D869_gp051 [Caulobacter phage CcrRogue]|uniref:Uncharacterized protein n=1 Tax=Caulobacter phage CcrRogue TaxID=2927986 RepID=K4JS25_9CAUD|nr:hypothetical protein D869_gp051 [Caulobacter phage CcrRogue]AFU86533.1 hypothetical protein CcrRogue_gp051 [Caulobacter phage CcrRogue]